MKHNTHTQQYAKHKQHQQQQNNNDIKQFNVKHKEHTTIHEHTT